MAGIGQGIGASPQIWAAVSSPIFDIMQADGFYAHLMAAISAKEKKLVRFAFVDNTDLCIYQLQSMPLAAKMKMQQLVDHWEDLLRATGGTLVPTKCFWFLSDFQMKNNKWQYVTKKQLGKLTIKDNQLQCIVIPHLEEHIAHCTLRVWLAPKSNWETEFNYLLLVAADWKVCMAASWLSHKDATFSLKSVVLQKLSYPLMTTTFTWQQCHQIMAPLLQTRAIKSWHGSDLSQSPSSQSHPIQQVRHS